MHFRNGCSRLTIAINTTYKRMLNYVLVLMFPTQQASCTFLSHQQT